MDLENYENILGRCIDSLKSCKELSLKYLNDNPKIPLTIKQLTEEYCIENFEVEKAERALTKVRNCLTKDNEDVDIDKLYNNFLKQDEIPQVYTDTEIWNSVYSGDDIQEVRVKEKRISDSDFRRLNESVSCANVFEPPIDPMSKTRITDPYKNRVCGHIFEYKFILNYVKDKKSKAKCPYVGCTNMRFRASDLQPDEMLKEKIQKYLETHQEESETSEDDD